MKIIWVKIIHYHRYQNCNCQSNMFQNHCSIESTNWAWQFIPCHQNKYHMYLNWICCLYWQWLARSHISPSQLPRRDRADKRISVILNETVCRSSIDIMTERLTTLVFATKTNITWPFVFELDLFVCAENDWLDHTRHRVSCLTETGLTHGF